jgi:hypothetical protein
VALAGEALHISQNAFTLQIRRGTHEACGTWGYSPPLPGSHHRRPPPWLVALEGGVPRFQSHITDDPHLKVEGRHTCGTFERGAFPIAGITSQKDFTWGIARGTMNLQLRDLKMRRTSESMVKQLINIPELSLLKSYCHKKRSMKAPENQRKNPDKKISRKKLLFDQESKK